jgi:hypothetical protein
LRNKKPRDGVGVPESVPKKSGYLGKDKESRPVDR